MLFTEQKTNIFLCNSHNSHSLSMCERYENEVVPSSQLFNCSAEVELPKIWIRKRTFAMLLRFHIASQKITPVYGRSFNNIAAFNGRQ